MPGVLTKLPLPWPGQAFRRANIASVAQAILSQTFTNHLCTGVNKSLRLLFLPPSVQRCVTSLS